MLPFFDMTDMFNGWVSFSQLIFVVAVALVMVPPFFILLRYVRRKK